MFMRRSQRNIQGKTRRAGCRLCEERQRHLSSDGGEGHGTDHKARGRGKQNERSTRGGRLDSLVGSSLTKSGSELKSQRGTAGLVWDSEDFDQDELDSTRGWLRDRAVTIYGGTNEVQQNIIAKRVLGLPD